MSMESSGIFINMLSNSLVTFTWHPSRDLQTGRTEYQAKTGNGQTPWGKEREEGRTSEEKLQNQLREFELPNTYQAPNIQNIEI